MFPPIVDGFNCFLPRVQVDVKHHLLEMMFHICLVSWGGHILQDAEGRKFHWIWVLLVRCTLHLVYCTIAKTQPQNTPLPISPWHKKLAMTSPFWWPFWPTHAYCNASVDRARTALSADAQWSAWVGQNDRWKTFATSSDVKLQSPNPPSLVDNKNLFCQ